MLLDVSLREALQWGTFSNPVELFTTWLYHGWMTLVRGIISTLVALGIPQDTILEQCHGIQAAEKGFLPFSTYFPKCLLQICSIIILE